MTNHVRMGIYSITQGTYEALLEKAREGLAPILRNSPVRSTRCRPTFAPFV
jgi:hypothetical protein